MYIISAVKVNKIKRNCIIEINKLNVNKFKKE